MHREAFKALAKVSTCAPHLAHESGPSDQRKEDGRVDLARVRVRVRVTVRVSVRVRVRVRARVTVRVRIRGRVRGRGRGRSRGRGSVRVQRWSRRPGSSTRLRTCPTS